MKQAFDYAKKIGVKVSTPEGIFTDLYGERQEDGDRVAHVRGITPNGNVVALGIAIQSWDGNEVFNPVDWTPEQVKEIDQKHPVAQGCVWFPD